MNLRRTQTLPSNVLVVAPHADDEAIGAGGLLARVARNGGQSTVFVGHLRTTERYSELAESCRLFGSDLKVSEFANSEFPVPERDLVKEMDAVLNNLEPDLMVIPANAVHPEHRLWFRVGIASTRPKGGSSAWRPQEVWSWEAPADHWGQVSQPTVFLSLDRTDLEMELSALRIHQSQYREFPSERSVEAIEALAKLRGAQSGAHYAEAFNCLRQFFEL